MSFPSVKRQALYEILKSLVREHDGGSDELDMLGLSDSERPIGDVERMVTALFRGELQ